MKICPECHMFTQYCECVPASFQPKPGERDLSHGRENPFSKAAWSDNKKHAAAQRWTLLQAILLRSQTNEELEDSTGILLQSICGGALWLRQQGYVAVKGRRKTRSGSWAGVNVATGKEPEAIVEDDQEPTLEELKGMGL